MNLINIGYVIGSFILSIFISYFNASKSWIDMMPPVERSISQEILNLWMFPSIILSLIFIVIFFVLNKCVTKKHINVFLYLVYFLLLVVVNLFAFYLGVQIVY